MLRAHELVHEEDVIRVSVSRRVEREFLIRLHDRTLEVKVIDDLGDRALVSDDGVTAQNYGVSFLDGDMTVRAEAMRARPAASSP